MIRIGLDTSCLNAKQNHDILNQLDELEKEHKIQLITSTVNEKEQSKIKNEFWKNKYLSRINEKEKVLEVGKFRKSRFRECKFGHNDKLQDIKKIIKIDPTSENDFFDLWLLETSLAGNCEYFLTLNSTDFINDGKQDKLNQIGVKARVPNKNFISELKEHLTTNSSLS